MLHGQFAPEYLVRPPRTPWSIIGGTHFHIAAERLINFSGIPTMITLMTVSALTAVLLHHAPAPQEKVKHRSETAVIRNGFDHILAANAALTLTIRLRKQVDSISAKKQLSETDSLTLSRALDSLQHIQLTLPH